MLGRFCQSRKLQNSVLVKNRMVFYLLALFVYANYFSFRVWFLSSFKSLVLLLSFFYHGTMPSLLYFTTFEASPKQARWFDIKICSFWMYVKTVLHWMGGFADLKRGQPKHGHSNKINTHTHEHTYILSLYQTRSILWIYSID